MQGCGVCMTSPHPPPPQTCHIAVYLCLVAGSDFLAY